MGVASSVLGFTVAFATAFVFLLAIGWMLGYVCSYASEYMTPTLIFLSGYALGENDKWSGTISGTIVVSWPEAGLWLGAVVGVVAGFRIGYTTGMEEQEAMHPS